MPSLTSCPRCDMQVLVPDGVRTETLVRCPLCDEEYPLGEVFDGVPMLVVVGGADAIAGESGAVARLAATPPSEEDFGPADFGDEGEMGDDIGVPFEDAGA